MLLGTTYILNDEPCLQLSEVILQSPGNKGFRRYQVINVIREGDRLAEYRKDLGKAKKFKGVDQFRIPGGVATAEGRYDILHTVGELIDIADGLRKGSMMDKREIIGINRIKEA